MDVLRQIRDQNWLFHRRSDSLCPGKKHQIETPKKASGQIMATSTTKRTAAPRKSTASKTTGSKTASTTPTSAPTTAKQTAEKTGPIVGAAGAKASSEAGSATSAVSTPEPKLVSLSDAVVSEADLKKRELIDLVVSRSGIKKKDAKPVVEAMLAVLGENIAQGRELNLQPLGKLRINRTMEKGNGRVIVCKLRQSLSVPVGPVSGPGDGPSGSPDKDSLAEAAE